MSQERQALARRAVACEDWRWMPGMLDTTGRTFIEYADCGGSIADHQYHGFGRGGK